MSATTRAARGRGRRGEGRGVDAVSWIAGAVTFAALAAIAGILGEQRLEMWLRLLAGGLGGVSAGALAVAVLGRSLAGRPRALRRTAGIVAVLVALALTVPFAIAHRTGQLGAPGAHGRAVEGLEPLGADDAAVTVPGAETPTPVLIRRTDGAAQLVTADGSRAVDLPVAAGDVPALTVDGRYVVVASQGRTRIAPASDPERMQEVAGDPVAAVGSLLVVRTCDSATCEERGIDLARPATPPRWTVDAGPQRFAPEAERAPLPAADATPAGPLDALRTAGILPGAALRWVEGQGWFWVDPRTGFLSGRRIAGQGERCRVVAPTSWGSDGRVSPVVAVCTGEGGALTVRAHRDGAPLWESAASPAGEWTARTDRGRVIAEGAPSDGSAEGVLVASEAAAAWAGPGGELVADGGPFTAQVGVDGRDVVLVTDDGQVIDHDLVTGEAVWTVPIGGSVAALRGSVADGTTVLLDERPRDDALDPRGAHRIRVVDDQRGKATAEVWSTRPPVDVRPISGGRALVVTRGRVLMLGV